MTEKVSPDIQKDDSAFSLEEFYSESKSWKPLLPLRFEQFWNEGKEILIEEKINSKLKIYKYLKKAKKQKVITSL